jgi:hypothetical protein
VIHLLQVQRALFPANAEGVYGFDRHAAVVPGGLGAVGEGMQVRHVLGSWLLVPGYSAVALAGKKLLKILILIFKTNLN